MKDRILKYIKNGINDPTRRSSMLNLALKPVSVILGLIYTPLLLSYLGDEKYGLWSTILSIISWVNYCDVGIGHGLRNVLTKAITLKDYEKAKKSISTAYVILSCISLTLLVISVVLVFALNWNNVFNTDIDMRMPLGISFVFICINFVLALSNTVFYSLQLSHRVALRNCVIQLLNIAGIVILKKYTSSSLFLISILFGMTTSFVYIVNTISLIRKNEFVRIKLKYYERAGVRDIANVGMKFFIIQVACLALYTVDNLLITNMFGGKAVTPFNITYRVFNTAYAFLTALCVPYWSKTTYAYEKRDIKWIRESIAHLNWIAVFFIAGFIVLAFLFKPIANLWLGRELEYPTGLVAVMCVYYCLYTIVTVKTQMINGTGELNFQLFLMTFMGAANIPLSIFLAKNCGLGVVGIRLATTILMAIAAIAFPINLRRIIDKVERER